MRRSACTGSENAHEVQRVARAHADFVAGPGGPTNPSQGIDRLGQRVLFGDETGDEPPSPHEPSGLAPPQRADDLAPWSREALSRHEVAKDDAVARE
jgi:hypothetical protein